MKKIIFTSLFFTVFFATCFSQATFKSNSSGAWRSASRWTLLAGTSTLNYPTIADSVFIENGHAITVDTTVECKYLNMKAKSSILLNSAPQVVRVTGDVALTDSSRINLVNGSIFITGNVAINERAGITQDSGLFNIVGLLTISSPFFVPGTSYLRLNGGAFNCIGAVTLIATPIFFNPNTFTEITIGNGLNIISGALTTISDNAKINFTGSGTLILSGVINFAQNNFNAGTGNVIFFGIPGIAQNVPAVVYHNLVISGIGNSLKTISGTTKVTDTLTLLTDTLAIINDGSLSINNNGTIVRTAGRMLFAPIFLGQVDLVYNNLLKDTTSFEMPSTTNTLRNLTINNFAGVEMNKNIYVNGLLKLDIGPLITGTFAVNISNPNGGITNDPAVNRTLGYVIGKINRNIGTSTGVRIFPFGSGGVPGYREFKLQYTTAPTVAGILNAQHFTVAPSNQTGLPLTDGAVNIVNTAPFYWQADATTGLAGGAYNLTLTAESTPGVTDLSTLRIVKRPSAGGNWVLNGTAGTNAGTNTSPIVLRNGMSGFSQFTLGGNASNPLPLTLLSFVGTENNGNILLQWKTTNEINTAYFIIERSKNGIDFSAIGKVDAKNVATQTNSYQLQDNNLVVGKYFYRLCMVDKDGQKTYSFTIALIVSKENILSVYPTMVQSNLQIKNSNGQAVYLLSAAGQLVQTLHEGVNDVSMLAQGVYFVKSIDKTIRVLKQ
jgi:hypothetical protein